MIFGLNLDHKRLCPFMMIKTESKKPTKHQKFLEN